MLALRVEDGLLGAIDYLAKASHTSRSGIVRQAIMQFLEDAEDLKLAESSRRKASSEKSLKQLRKELELDR